MDRAGRGRRKMNNHKGQKCIGTTADETQATNTTDGRNKVPICFLLCTKEKGGIGLTQKLGRNKDEEDREEK